MTQDTPAPPHGETSPSSQRSTMDATSLPDSAASSLLHTSDSADAPDGGVNVPQEQPAASWVVSLLFWVTLCVAASLYAAVALAPKTAEWLTARQQYVDNVRRLAHLENEVEYLERVAATLQQDPDFARRLAQASLPSTGPDQLEPQNQTLLPVTQDLLFGGIQPVPEPGPQTERAAWEHWVFLLASDARHRMVLLSAAIVLTVLSFTFLNGSEDGYLRSSARVIAAVMSAPVRRYRAAATPAPPAAAAAAEAAPAADTAEVIESMSADCRPSPPDDEPVSRAADVQPSLLSLARWKRYRSPPREPAGDATSEAPNS